MSSVRAGAPQVGCLYLDPLNGLLDVARWAPGRGVMGMG